MKDWLILIRLQGAGIGVILPIIPYLMVTHGVPSLWGLISFGIFGLLVQALGMADNQVADYPYDMLDPNKRHFPLVAGKIRPRDADLFVKFLLVLVVVYGGLLARGDWKALLFLLVSALSGLLYNHYNKTKLWKPIPLAVCFSTIPMYIYYSMGIEPTIFLLLPVLYVFIYMVYQVGVTGELKDLETSERSFTKTLGARLEGGYFFSTPGLLAYSISLKVLNLLVALVIASITGALVESILLSALIVVAMGQSLRNGRWERESRLRSMLSVELLSYWLFLVSIWPVIGALEALLIMILPIFLAVPVNMLLYGDIWPRF